jgi:hypothetical protein
VRQIAFPKVRPHAPNTKQTPARADLPFWGRVKQALWAAGSRLRENDAKYGVKTGLATAALAAPAFFEATRPVFLEYRGEWALISVSFGAVAAFFSPLGDADHSRRSSSW